MNGSERQTYKMMANHMESWGLPTAFSTTRTGGRKQQQRPHRRSPLESHPAVRAYFDKRFPLPPRSPLPSGLPEPSKMYQSDSWQDPYLQSCKRELNEVKNKLNNFDLAEWHRHTHHMNLAGEVVRTLRQQFSPEFITQAWCKFYEVASSFDLVPPSLPDGGDFNSVHLCEAPGAFVTALNHYLKLNRKVQWRWLSTTLNPYHEGNPLSCMINDDRFLLQTLDRWDFGRDFTGDLTDLANMWHLVGRSRRMGDVHLVTADGSVDCQMDPGEQERLVSGLHFCETVAALHILAPGGSFLLKLFTTFEQETACLVYLLRNAFREVEFFKPATSREGNSEVYLVCLGYLGAPALEPWLRELRHRYGKVPPEKAMFPRTDIPEPFMAALYRCANYFKDLQVGAMERNIETFRSSGEGAEEEDTEASEDSVRKLKLALARHFVAKYRVARIRDGDQVVGMGRLRQTVTLNMAPKVEAGTFSGNLSVRSLSPEEQLREMCREVGSLHRQHLQPLPSPFEGDVRWLKFSGSTGGRLSVVTGKRVDKVRSSKFCFGPLLCLRNKVLELASTLNLRPPQEGEGALPSGDPRERLGLRDATVLDFEGSEETSSPLAPALEALRKVPVGGNLLLLGFSTLTQLRAGLVYLLGHMFDRVGFVKPSGRPASVAFLSLRPRGEEPLRSHLEEACRTEESLRGGDPSLAVLGLVAVDALCGRNCPRPESPGPEEDGDLGSTFYDTVTHVNNLTVREQIARVAEAALLVGKGGPSPA